MHQVQAELANAYAQEFFTTVREKCFRVRLETVVVVEFVREEMLRTVHGTVRGRDEDDQPSGFETV